MPTSEIVKGYEFEKGRYVVLSEEDIDKVRPESPRVIDLVQFTDESAIRSSYWTLRGHGPAFRSDRILAKHARPRSR